MLVCRNSDCYYYHVFFSFLVGVNHLLLKFPKEAVDPGALAQLWHAFLLLLSFQLHFGVIITPGKFKVNPVSIPC